MAKNEMEKLMNSRQVSEKTGVAMGTLANWAYRGDHPQLPFHKVGRRRMYPASAVKAFIGPKHTDTGELS